MIFLWGTSLAERLTLPFARKNAISWQEIPILTKFKALAEIEGVQLNKKKPFGVRRNFNNTYANPLTMQIVVGDKLLKKLDEGPLTALIGHEITHFKRQHAIKTVFWSLTIPTMLTLPLLQPETPKIIHDVALWAMFLIVFLFLSWHHEYEADTGGARIAGTKNWISLLRKVVPRGQRRYESETHPSVHSRILKLKKRNKQSK
jgi:Zn-dependent protease with chaperone function